MTDIVDHPISISDAEQSRAYWKNLWENSAAGDIVEVRLGRLLLVSCRGSAHAYCYRTALGTDVRRENLDGPIEIPLQYFEVIYSSDDVALLLWF